MLRVEVVYIAADQSVFQKSLVLDAGIRVREALLVSGIYLAHPETEQCSIGIYTKPVSLDTFLQDGDRLELYRELTRDPKEKRRALAKKQ